ncbi:MAG: hypothetical protein WCT03_07155 [Candidatus Obscuribacterales bacterium]|jgi:hypothetical protein
MARQKQTPQIITRLAAGETTRFFELCSAQGKNHAELARQAIREMLAREESGIEAEVRDRLAEEVTQLQDLVKALLLQQKKTENRMAALIARNNIDIGIVYQLLWFRADRETREKMFQEARVHAIKRASQKLKEGDLEVKEMMKDALSS